MERSFNPLPHIRLDLTDVISNEQGDGPCGYSTVGSSNNNDIRHITPVRSAYRGLAATVGQDLLHYNDDKSRPQRYETSWPLSLSEWMNPSFSSPRSRPALSSLDRSDSYLGLVLSEHVADVFDERLPPISTRASPNQMPQPASQAPLLPAIDFKRPPLPTRSQSDNAIAGGHIQRANGVPADRMLTIISEYERVSPLCLPDQGLADAKQTTTISNIHEERSEKYLSPKSRRPETLWRSKSSGGVFECHKVDLHKFPGPRGLRYKVSDLPEKGGWEPNSNEGHKRAQSNSFMRMPRSHTASAHLANMVAGRGGQGKLAQAHYETIITPPRPKVVQISGCKSSPTPLQSASPLDHASTLVSAFDPETPTPPETPGELIQTGEPTFLQRLEACKVCEGERHDELPATPPSTPALSLRGSFTTQDATIMQAESSRSKPSIAVSDYTLDWVLYELESSVFRFPRKTLQLSSPVIQHIRTQFPGSPDPNSRRGSTGTSAKTYGPPSFDPPHSRYSILNPLASHPVSPSQRMDGWPSSLSPQSWRPTNNVRGSLRTIFPKASELELDTVHASQLALSYIVNVLDPQPLYRSSSSHIPPKARATLGLRTLSPHSPSETSWFRSRSSSPAIDELLRERMEFVKEGLRDALRGLLVGMVQENLDYAGETLLLAVGEVVRLGEERN